MERNLAILGMLAAIALATSAWAGDIIIVEETAIPTSATPMNSNALDSTQGLTSRYRTILRRAISVGCKQKAGRTETIRQLSTLTGRDSAREYCDCMSPYMAENLSLAMLKSIASTRAMPPELQAGADQQAKYCIKVAGGA
jgi:hypothetical protein